jgi:hypothetical protein
MPSVNGGAVVVVERRRRRMGVRGDIGNGEGRGDGCFIIYIGCRKRCSDPAVMLKIRW